MGLCWVCRVWEWEAVAAAVAVMVVGESNEDGSAVVMEGSAEDRVVFCGGRRKGEC
jgi:hypothetical protein